MRVLYIQWQCHQKHDTMRIYTIWAPFWIQNDISEPHSPLNYIKMHLCTKFQLSRSNGAAVHPGHTYRQTLPFIHKIQHVIQYHIVRLLDSLAIFQLLNLCVAFNVTFHKACMINVPSFFRRHDSYRWLGKTVFLCLFLFVT